MPRKTLVFTASLLIAFNLSACAESNTTGTSEAATNGPNPVYTGKVPDFTGPYASQFTTAYQNTSSDLARQILQDEQITESEFAEAQAALGKCLESQGYSDIAFFPDGGFSLTAPDGLSEAAGEKIMKECDASSGIGEVEPIYTSILVNPNNEDWDQLNVDCLIREGVVEPGFTKEDLDQWYANEDPRLGNGGEADKCTTDPLGLLDGSVQ